MIQAALHSHAPGGMSSRSKESSTSGLLCSMSLLRPDTYSSSELRVWVVITIPGGRVEALGEKPSKKETLVSQVTTLLGLFLA